MLVSKSGLTGLWRKTVNGGKNIIVWAPRVERLAGQGEDEEVTG